MTHERLASLQGCHHNLSIFYWYDTMRPPNSNFASIIYKIRGMTEVLTLWGTGVKSNPRVRGAQTFTPVYFELVVLGFKTFALLQENLHLHLRKGERTVCARDHYLLTLQVWWVSIFLSVINAKLFLDSVSPMERWAEMNMFYSVAGSMAIGVFHCLSFFL